MASNRVADDRDVELGGDRGLSAAVEECADLRATPPCRTPEALSAAW
ncbi:hypothetical protein BN6_10400 [Saccharothrix espanaensis DSM 44229]|uniref:Uncharacterized protein n=1 Tax=Saccharothrix espanaensis (strain ATCC 51144 / DSM 44229 / JCM 9112 / NBRC 15066 / NRRL 15764) TaxID=1179773 RepID=K0JVX8_SACES|nr:hypothetical protein BN6_10400 [Saccharothrix espanaensis DSM 44229]